MNTKRKITGGIFAGIGGGLFALQPLDVGVCSLSLTLFALGVMIANNQRLAVFRQGLALALVAMAGTTIPALLTDPSYYWMVGLIAYLLLAGAYYLCKPLKKGEVGNG